MRWVEILEGSDVQEQRDVLAFLLARVEPVRLSHAGRRSIYAITPNWTPLGQLFADAGSLDQAA